MTSPAAALAMAGSSPAFGVRAVIWIACFTASVLLAFEPPATAKSSNLRAPNPPRAALHWDAK
jgi:hypothetical protein